MNIDMWQEIAIDEYQKKTGRIYKPGPLIQIPVDALVFAEYQSVWKDLDEYKKARCIYDEETNEELVYFVTDLLRQPGIPAVYIDVLDDGVALVDGVHRTTSALIAGQSHINARVNNHQ